MSWRISLLGKVEATRNGVTVSKFESGRAVALLARLALFPKRTHPREELCELLWPEVEPEAARVRLRHNLSVLRKQLEAGLPSGSVLVADRLSVRLNPEAFTTDVAELERTKDKRLYTGELLPGLWDDWIIEERYRFEALVEGLKDRAEPATPISTIASTETPASLSPELARKHSLPPYLTRFIGREAEQEQLGELLAQNRLVTILGMGGTGKTRLTVEALRSTEGVFVSLAECVSAAQIPGRIRAALGLPALEANPLEQIAFAMEGCSLLLALDNLEQLVETGGAELIEVLLSRLPELTVLVTSRRALGIPGERLLLLDPLSQAEGLALFLDRAQSVRPGFSLTEGNRADIQSLCEGLEGIPLALELAASRLRAFSPAELRQELGSRLDWLARTGLKGAKDDRHRSLAATLDWSWRLISVSQQQFLATLALFRGGFSVAEAAAVADTPDARERLETLVADSLVTLTELPDGALRYGLLETVREFVLPQLRGAADARYRFREYFIAQRSPGANGAAAWQYALEDEDSKHAYALATLKDSDWTGRLGVARARELIERTLALPAPDQYQWLQAMHALAHCLLREADRQGAMALIDKAAEALENAPEELLLEALMSQAHIGLYDAPQEKTLALLDRCLALARDPFARAEALRMKGSRICWMPNYEDATAIFAEAATLYAPQDPAHHRMLIDQGFLARRRGNFEEALNYFRLCAEQAKQADDRVAYRNARGNMVDALTYLGRWQEAIEVGQECLKIEEAHGDRYSLLGLLWNLSRPLLEVGELERSARLMSAAATLWVREIHPLTSEEQEEVAVVRTRLSQALDESTLARLWAEGERFSLQEALVVARGR